VGLVVLVSSCGKPQEEQGSVTSRKSLKTVYTVNYPLQYFAQRIAGDTLTVVFPMTVDEHPAYWKPAVHIIQAYQNADLILLNGADYAKWLKTAVLSQSTLIDTSKACKDHYIELEDVMTHSHGPGGEHAHGNVAFTVWLDMQIALKQAEAIAAAFAARDAANSATYEANLKTLKKDLVDLDTQLKGISKTNPETLLIGSHPVYQYLTEAYGLNLAPVHWEPEEMPTEEMWNEFKELLTQHPAKWLVWEGEPGPEIVARLKALGINSLTFDPAGATPQKRRLAFCHENKHRTAEASL
jgi:zinc transport system substrate-binding protein